MTLEHANWMKRPTLLFLLLLLLCGTGFSQQVMAQTPYTWGYNAQGQLGVETDLAYRNIPKKIPAPAGTQQIAGGSLFSLALKSDGTVWAWGDNREGQLGNGTNDANTIPVQVSGLTSAVQVSAGFYHSLALKSDGTVWAWGRNVEGQLGNGTNDASNVPVQVSGLTGVVQVVAAGLHSLALKSDGTVWAWGHNAEGQLGNGTNDGSNVPVQVINLDGVLSIASGQAHGLGLRYDGRVWAWGSNTYGQLGEGTYNSTNVPVQCAIDSVLQVAGNGSNTVAIRFDGKVWAWGYNNDGELGDGTNTTSNLPVQTANLSNVINVSVGLFHSLALTAEGTVWAWGFNGQGQLGNGTLTDSNIPIVTNLQGMTLIAAGGYHSLSLGTTHLTTVTIPNLTSVYGATTLMAKVTLGKTALPLLMRKAFFKVDGVYVWAANTDASGTASTPPLGGIAAGKHTVAVYVQPYGAFNEASGKGTLIVSKAPTSLGVNGSLSVHRGETTNLGYLLTRNSDGAFVPNMKVSFTLDAVAIGSATTDSNGIATLTYAIPTTTKIGNHTLVASFGGDSNHIKSTLSSTLVVLKADANLVTANLNAAIGQKATASAVLTDKVGGGGLGGKLITFLVDGNSVGTAKTNSAGKANLRILVDEPLVQGTHTITASFAGDGGYTPPADSSGTLTVSRASTKLAQTSVIVKPNSTVNLTAKLKRNVDGKPLAGRTVGFFVDGVGIGTATTDANGVATYPYTANLAVGTYALSATFDGDDYYGSSFIDSADLIVK